MNNLMNIAIDGPAGAGKSTVAKLVAERLSYLYIDTGAMYRALTYAALEKNVNLEDEDALDQLLEGIDIDLKHTKNGVLVYVNKADVTELIRTDDVNKHVSLVASHPSVRIEMVERQRTLAKGTDAVLDGRDIGTYVLPDAELKVFLTASVEERARRRHEEQVKKGLPSNFEELKKDIARRDELDSTREFAPLKKANDAVEIDSTSMSIEEVAASIINLAKERAS
ncbi:(d)CMP kinase [Alkalihalophilus marmarensis]|jgi:cytidylate kinase|uniref:Cytidylate kinase n=1 Tax=Alkalihalophilus marmarensis DSM 21297 TaxID=1188261 RepID=U6SR11_9BACI|nr:(d)CMP kinase [Alkalihalophilus marmarensis]ERN54159.1 cytidylate kinase [Alkalihalophilus marmarensis DSM 21297]MCM3488420.1 (d)CMP kinase [Alkalihalophilus marmarensis]